MDSLFVKKLTKGGRHTPRAVFWNDYCWDNALTMPIITHAIAAFQRPPERLNCAQAVLFAHQPVSGRLVVPIPEFKPFGGGRAPDGECGALYAACRAAPDAADAMRTAFVARAGSRLCRDLKAFGCKECVAIAAELLQLHASLG